MNKIIQIAAVSAVLMTACHTSAPGRGVVPPDAQAESAAKAFVGNRTGSGVRVFFSQISGQILWIESSHEPLYVAGGTQPGDLRQALIGFTQDYPDLFRLDNPEQQLSATADSVAGTGPVRSIRLRQLHGGIAIHGKYILGIFNAKGALLSIQADLIPTAQIAARLPAPPSAQEVQQYPGVQLLKWKQSNTGTYRLIHEQATKNGIQTIRTLRDPKTMQTLETVEDLPSNLVSTPKGWEILGTLTSALAFDDRYLEAPIPSTLYKETLILGYPDARTLCAGCAVKISDAATQYKVFPSGALTTDQPSWEEEVDFVDHLRDTTRIAEHIQTVLHWFKDQLQYSSWDGRGASIQAVVRVRTQDASKPEVNAFGGNGWIMIGDGTTPTGQTFGEGIDVIAHEFTHSVINATANFTYTGESGALNESLADVFGESVRGFTSMIVGDLIGKPLRNMINPEEFDHPGNYADFVDCTPDHDHGCVHSNSGITNRSLTQWIVGDSDGAGVGIAVGTRLLLDSLIDLPFDPNNSLEDFSAALTGFCLAQDTLDLSVCQNLETRFVQNALLSQPLSAALEF